MAHCGSGCVWSISVSHDSLCVITNNRRARYLCIGEEILLSYYLCEWSAKVVHDPIDKMSEWSSVGRSGWPFRLKTIKTANVFSIEHILSLDAGWSIKLCWMRISDPIVVHLLLHCFVSGLLRGPDVCWWIGCSSLLPRWWRCCLLWSWMWRRL